MPDAGAPPSRRPDQHPSAAASDLVSIGGSDDGELDDSLSLAASEAEELLGSYNDPAPSQSTQPSASSPGMDADLFHVLSNAMEALGLEWSPPEEPSRGHLDEWLFPARRQPPRQRASPFFPEVHDAITKSWRAPYSSRASSSSTLTSVDGAEEKGYDSLPPLDESVAVHLCQTPLFNGWV